MRILTMHSLIVALTVYIALLSCPTSVHSTTYVINVAQGPNRGAPYVRGINNQHINLKVGQGDNVGNYQMTVDTGSPYIDVPCSTPGSRSRNCSSSSYYSLAKSSLIGSSTCKAYGNATGCYATNPAGGYTDGACFWESELTGGNGYNGLIGVFGSDTVTLTDSSPVLSWSGQVACSESLFSCTEKDEPCIIQHQTTNSCPPPPPPPATQCPVGNGTEAGFAPGPVSVTAQVFNSGLLGGSNSLSFCYLRPSINTDCSASPVNNGSKIIFGPAGLPPSIKSVSSLHSTDLIYQTFHGFLEFRSLSTGAVVPTFGSNTSAKINLQTSILWDTGAYGQSTVPARLQSILCLLPKFPQSC